MNSRDAFFQTLDRFGIVAAEVSRKSCVPPEVISKYRNSKQSLRLDTFDKMLNALPEEARFYYFALRLGGKCAESGAKYEC